MWDEWIQLHPHTHRSTGCSGTEAEDQKEPNKGAVWLGPAAHESGRRSQQAWQGHVLREVKDGDSATRCIAESADQADRITDLRRSEHGPRRISRPPTSERQLSMDWGGKPEVC